MKTIKTLCPEFKRFEEEVKIVLPFHGSIKYCRFIEDAIIDVDKLGDVVYNYFEKDVTITSRYMCHHEDRQFSMNIVRGKLFQVQGTFDINENHLGV